MADQKKHTADQKKHTADQKKHTADQKKHTADQKKHTRRGPPTADGAENAQRHPEEWVTGDAPMTEGQATFLQALSEEAEEPFDGALSKADASERIEALQLKARRGHPKRILEEDQTDG